MIAKGTNASIMTNYNQVSPNIGMHVSSIYSLWNDQTYVETGWYKDSNINGFVAFWRWQDRTITSQQGQDVYVLAADKWYYFETLLLYPDINYWKCNIAGIVGAGHALADGWGGYSICMAERHTWSDTNYAMFKNCQFKRNGSWYMFPTATSYNPYDNDPYYHPHLHSSYSGRRDYCVY